MKPSPGSWKNHDRFVVVMAVVNRRETAIRPQGDALGWHVAPLRGKVSVIRVWVLARYVAFKSRTSAR